MEINNQNLATCYKKFTDFINKIDNEKFSSFKNSKFIENEENYKYSVFNEAKEKLGSNFWNESDLGKGLIKKKVENAIQANVVHNRLSIQNNLVNWRTKDEFSKKGNINQLEKLFFNFYKNKISNKEAFESMIGENISYQLTAYLFFIKDKDQFLPISQEKFDKIFEILGIQNFKTNRNNSWKNYETFLNIIKQVRKFLKTKDPNTTLLDAHSFLWIIGNQMVDNDSKTISNTKDTEHKQGNLIITTSNEKALLELYEWKNLIDKEIPNGVYLDKDGLRDVNIKKVIIVPAGVKRPWGDRPPKDKPLMYFEPRYLVKKGNSYGGYVIGMVKTYVKFRNEKFQVTKLLTPSPVESEKINEEKLFEHNPPASNTSEGIVNTPKPIEWKIGSDTQSNLPQHKDLFLEEEEIQNEKEKDDSEVGVIKTIIEKYSQKEILEMLYRIEELKTNIVELESVTTIRYKRYNVIVAIIKELRGNKCQFPNCTNSPVIKKDGSIYIEAAHIIAKSNKGEESLKNLILLCPNHHKEFDLGHREEISLPTDSNNSYEFKLNNEGPYKINLSIL
jgi:hypothetical protein